MDEKTDSLGQWTFEEDDAADIPKGWDLEASTPEQRDREKLLKEVGPMLSLSKSPEEIEKMSNEELYALTSSSSEFAKSALSGLTFGLLKTLCFEAFRS